MSIINSVSGLVASKHSTDFNYYNYYASKPVVVKAGKELLLDTRGGKKSLAFQRLRPHMHS